MSESQEPSKTPWNQKLFNLMMQEHDVICTESDMDAIIQVCREIDPCRPPQPVQPAEPVEGAPALEKLIEAFAHEIHYGKSGQYTPLTQLDIDIIEAARQEAANRRPSTGEDERVAVLLSRLDAVCCILAIVDGSMPTKQELGMAYDELVSVRDDVAGIIRHLPAPSHSDVEQLLDDCLLYLQSAEKNIQDHSPFAGTPWHDRLKKLIGQLYERKYKMTTATKGSE